MNNYIELNLIVDKDRNKKLHYNNEFLNNHKKDLDNFLDNNTEYNNIDFAKKVMMTQELKANNNIEGIIDNLESIEKVVNNKNNKKNLNERRRIINLYNGYKYILQNKNINKDNLRKLYSILSKDLLNEHDKANMGYYYRKKPVYIIRKNRLDLEPYQGLPAEELDFYMNCFFDYTNTNITNRNEIEEFIKSQIMHYYFVYIHPYFDVNGRTSRTVSMWYLLNNKTYPYIIFNRAISFAKTEYEESIVKCRNRADVTLFLKYMLIQVLKELEKEYIINNIKLNSGLNLKAEEEQILEYFININGNLTAKDLTKFYNYHNFKETPKKIYTEKILPLIDNEILKIDGYTKSYIYNKNPNIWLKLNKKYIDIDKNKLKYLKLDKYI